MEVWVGAVAAQRHLEGTHNGHVAAARSPKGTPLACLLQPAPRRGLTTHELAHAVGLAVTHRQSQHGDAV